MQITDLFPVSVTLSKDPYWSPCAPGWDTVLGYLSKHNPEALALMDEDAEATLRDGYWLTHRCKKLGITPRKVQAPVVLIRQGIFEVNSYPILLLEQRLG